MREFASLFAELDQRLDELGVAEGQPTIQDPRRSQAKVRRPDRRTLTCPWSLAVAGRVRRCGPLSRLNPDDREAIRTLSAQIRRTIEGVAIPGYLAAAITHALAGLGEPSRLRRPIQRDETDGYVEILP